MQVTAEGDTLTITAAKKEEEKVEKGKFVRRERYMEEVEMTRTFTLPTIVDAEKVEAVFEHGILKLYIPKLEHTAPQQIPIKIKELVGAH